MDGTQMTGLPPLFFQKYRFVLEVSRPMQLPEYKGSTFRGGVLMAFKDSVCLISHGRCEHCPLTEHCSYYALFESQTGDSSGGVPLPYVIEPPLTERRMFDAGDPLEFSVLLIGKVTAYWKLLVFAVKRLGHTRGIGRRVDGRRGRFRLKRVDSIGVADSQVTVYSDDLEFSHDPPITLTGETVSATGESGAYGVEASAIHFLTPVCLIEKHGGNGSVRQRRLVTELDFAKLMKSLIRRVSLLSQAYCGGEPPAVDFLLKRAALLRVETDELQRHDFERYSRRQRARHPVSGVKGTVRFSGDFTPFLPYLRVGEWLHLGKKTTFGLGQYRLLDKEL